MKKSGQIYRISSITVLSVLFLNACGGGGGTPANSAPTASNVGIVDDNAGSLVIGDSLTGSYSYSDADNDAEGTSTFRWLRNGTVINGAIGTTYTTVAADNGQVITFEVTPVAVAGALTGSAVSSAGITVNASPVATAVTITDGNGGNVLIGDSLTGSYVYTDTDGDIEGASTYRWLRNGTAISGATGLIYTPVLADSNQEIAFEVTPVATTGTITGNPVVSSSVVVVNNAPVASGVTISGDTAGTAIVGDTLTGNYTYTDSEGDAEGATAFQWLRSGVAISGATSLSYTVDLADNGLTISFEVTPAAATGTPLGSAVASTGVTVNNAPAATGVSISDGTGGVAVIGDVLTGSYTYSDVEGDSEGVTSFRWLRNGLAITGATLSTYTLVSDDSGQVISFEVTPVATTGTITGSAVTSDIPVDNPPTATNVNIDDLNDDRAVEGDVLEGSYDYADIEGDAEGVTTFRWLRDGVAISGATTTSYTLVAADVPTEITFEVTPIALTGEISGIATTSPPLATGLVPVVNGAARYIDTNNNAISDANDQLIIPFDQAVDTNAGSGSDFNLPVTGDTLGSGATIAAGPASNEVTINLGTSPVLKTRHDFSAIVTALNSASGIDVAASMAADVIESPSGLDAIASTPFDLFPGYMDSSQSLGSSDSTSLTLGDIDGDGDVDIVVANDAQGNRVYTNDGTGTFTDSAQSLGTNNSRAVALGDVDNDGDLDMVVANDAQGNRIYTNDGTGTFTDSAQSLGTNNSRGIALGDIDGDGDLDMVIANNAQENRVYTNNGSGTFTDSGQSLGTNNSRAVALGDVDGDGDLDMVVANDAQENLVYANDGTGVFSDTSQSMGTNNSSALSLGDLNGDGDLDIAVANTSGQGDRIYFGSLSGTWGTASYVDSSQSLGSFHTLSVALGDIDHDGDLDMVTANDSSILQSNRVYTNDGNGTFTDTGQSFGTNDSFSIALGDIDNDGDLDMVVANVGESNQIYTNNGSGIFSDSGQSLGSYDSRAVVLGDVDADGDLDMVVANTNNPSTRSNRVYVNNSGTFTDSGQTLGTSNSFDVALGDIDNDGDLDMVVANNPDNKVYLNDGTGNYTDSGQSLGTNLSFGIALGDLDQDGDLDMVVANMLGGSNRVYTNDGNGVFSDSGQALGANNSFSVALGDVDGDGDLDMVIANTDNQSNRIYLNDGSGNFTDSTQSLGINDSTSAALGDIDHDGDLDVVIGNSEAQGNRVYFNQ